MIQLEGDGIAKVGAVLANGDRAIGELRPRVLSVRTTIAASLRSGY